MVYASSESSEILSTKLNHEVTVITSFHKNVVREYFCEPLYLRRNDPVEINLLPPPVGEGIRSKSCTGGWIRGIYLRTRRLRADRERHVPKRSSGGMIRRFISSLMRRVSCRSLLLVGEGSTLFLPWNGNDARQGYGCYVPEWLMNRRLITSSMCPVIWTY